MEITNIHFAIQNEIKIFPKRIRKRLTKIRLDTIEFLDQFSKWANGYWRKCYIIHVAWNVLAKNSIYFPKYVEMIHLLQRKRISSRFWYTIVNAHSYAINKLRNLKLSFSDSMNRKWLKIWKDEWVREISCEI